MNEILKEIERKKAKKLVEEIIELENAIKNYEQKGSLFNNTTNALRRTLETVKNDLSKIDADLIDYTTLNLYYIVDLLITIHI